MNYSNMVTFQYSNGRFTSKGRLTKDNFSCTGNELVQINCIPPYNGSSLNLVYNLCDYINSLCLGYRVETFGVTTDIEFFGKQIKSMNVQLRLI